MQELHVFGFGAETHDALYAGAVVPASIEKNQLSGSGQMGDVALEIPLSFLALRWGTEGNNAANARIQALRDSLDGSALTGGISALEQHDHLQAAVADPLLHLDEFNLQAPQLLVVVAISS